MNEKGQPERHIEAARQRLGHLAGVASRTRAAEQRILEAGRDRIAAVNADLEKLGRRALLDDGAADQYQALVAERGQLAIVVANAERALA
jgi:hypothetical protein